MNQIEEMELSRKALQERVEKRDEVLKLYDNDKFKSLILEGFCRDDAARCVAAAGNPGTPERDEKQLLGMAMAGGHLKRYLMTIIQQGDQAENEITQVDEIIDELRAENADEETATADNSNVAE